MRVSRSLSRLSFALACAFSATAGAVAPADRWNLQDLYPDAAAWTADAARLEADVQRFSGCQGQLGRGAARLAECLLAYEDVQKRLARLANYASFLHDQDTGDAAGLDLNQRADILAGKVDAASAFLRPEVLALGPAAIARFTRQDARLKRFAHPLDDILRMRPHTRDAAGEGILADFGVTANAAQTIYGTLSNAEMSWPTLTLEGKPVTLDAAAYTKYRTSSDRAVRQDVFKRYWASWKGLENTYGVSFYEMLKKDAAYARIRHYPDSLTMALDANRIPRAVYDRLIEQTRANLPTLHRYLKLRQRMLGLPDLGYPDIYPPLLPVSEQAAAGYPLATGKRLMLDAVAPLGGEYVAALTHAVDARWMDVYPTPRKRSGAYMQGTSYDVHPYILLNYNDDFESVSTLAHEWGHGMHSYLANRAQPFITSDYPIFTAEIASTTNQVFLQDHMLKIAKSDDERLLYLGAELEVIRGTFFRQAMFADFERTVHDKVDHGESLTGAALSQIYGALLKQYHGDAQGVMKIDDAYAIEWAAIPHFYNRFYVFQYATSIAAGTMFADEILRGTPHARERYLDILKAGSSAYPYELVKAAGVDLASPRPYQAIVARMNAIMDQIEAILGKR